MVFGPLQERCFTYTFANVVPKKLIHLIVVLKLAAACALAAICQRAASAQFKAQIVPAAIPRMALGHCRDMEATVVDCAATVFSSLTYHVAYFGPISSHDNIFLTQHLESAEIVNFAF
jgi:hypothetical protein